MINMQFIPVGGVFEIDGKHYKADLIGEDAYPCNGCTIEKNDPDYSRCPEFPPCGRNSRHDKLEVIFVEVD